MTLLLRRTLSELDSRSKHLNESNIEKLALHGDVEKCKVRLERLMRESEDLRKRTEDAEERARRVLEDENNAVGEADARAASAEKRFEILVDWSRKEETKRMIAEETMRDAVARAEHLAMAFEESGGALKRDCAAMQEALDASNAGNLAKHKALLDREAQFLEQSKGLAVAEQLSASSRSENKALKNLCAKLEGEVEGTRGQLKSMEHGAATQVSV